ncbi:hypothetical protein [Methanomethylophilus alvi]|uniref:hypothetical protein n=1 Tax=Methanomethylophilus alvi TaxID=1291540 RepID=UPI0037DC8456
MNQTKEETNRRLAVPVLTIAVCAMAMIGFGFALTTDVTSESDVGVFQVDLSDDYATISAAKSVADETSVNKVFDGYVQSSKAGNGTVTYRLIGAEAYLKVFGDDGANVVLKMTTTDSTHKYVVSLYTTDGTTDTPVQEGVVVTNAGVQFTNPVTPNTTVYKVKITDIQNADNGLSALKSINTDKLHFDFKFSAETDTPDGVDLNPDDGEDSGRITITP